MRTDERGAQQPAAPVRYRTYLAPGGVRYQAEPPVCNACGHEITRHNFGWAYLTSAADAREQVEWIVCTACTNIRQVGPPMRQFLALHHL